MLSWPSQHGKMLHCMWPKSCSLVQIEWLQTYFSRSSGLGHCSAGFATSCVVSACFQPGLQIEKYHKHTRKTLKSTRKTLKSTQTHQIGKIPRKVPEMDQKRVIEPPRTGPSSRLGAAKLKSGKVKKANKGTSNKTASSRITSSAGKKSTSERCRFGKSLAVFPSFLFFCKERLCVCVCLILCVFCRLLSPWCLLYFDQFPI